MTSKASSSEDRQEALEVVPTAEPETQALHVMSAYRRMLLAQKVIDGMPFAKDLSNSQYKSVPIDTMRAAVRKACLEAGLAHRLINIEYTREIRGSGTYFYEGRAVMVFENVDDPQDVIEHPTLGSAMDNGDKGVGKFVTNLIKNAYKEVFDIGERGRDDIDAYANEDIMEEADRIAERRAKSREKAQADPFFSDPRAALRKRIGAMLSKDGPDYVEGAEEVVSRYKAEHGQLPQWSREVLEQCVAECMGGGQ